VSPSRRYLVIAAGVGLALAAAWELDRVFAAYTAGLFLVYLGSRR
jgi:PPE-repeat protein